MKNPVVRSRSGRSCSSGESWGEASRGATAPRSSSASAGAPPEPALEQRRDSILVLAPRDRAGRGRPACRPAPAASPRGAARSSWTPRSRSIPLGDLRQRASGREASAPRSEQGASRRSGSKPAPAAASFVASPSNTVTPWRSRRTELPGRQSRRRAPRRPARPRSPRPDPPSGSTICPVLIPGPAQRSSTCSPSCGSSTSTTAAEPRLCGVSSPAATSLPAPPRRCGRRSTIELRRGERPARPPGRAPPPRPRRSARQHRLAVAAQACRPASPPRPARCRRRAAPRAASAPSSSHHIRASHFGAESATAAAAGVESSPSSAAVSCAALAGRAAQDRVGEAGGVGGARAS